MLLPCNVVYEDNGGTTVPAFDRRSGGSTGGSLSAEGFAREVADRAIFMDEGQIVEEGKPAELIASPQHERTQAFLSRIL